MRLSDSDGDFGIVARLSDDSDGDEVILQLENTRFLIVEEQDGTPVAIDVRRIKVSNNTLTNLGSGVVSIVTGSDGGGGGGPVGLFFPDLPPASPHANDDEFDDASIGGAWTDWDHGSVGTNTEGTYGLKIANSNATGPKFAGLRRALPSGDWSIVTKVSLVAVLADDAAASLILLEDATSATGDLKVFSLVYGSTGVALYSQTWNDYQTFAATQASISADVGPTWIYLRVRKSGSTYSQDFSHDGLSWMRLWTGTLAFTPAHIGLGCNNNGGAGTSECAGYFRFWRQTSSTLLDQPLQGATG